MNITIISINPVPNEDGTGFKEVRVYFNTDNGAGTFTMNGYIPIAYSDYEGNEPLPLLKELVKERIIEVIQ